MVSLESQGINFKGNKGSPKGVLCTQKVEVSVESLPLER